MSRPFLHSFSLRLFALVAGLGLFSAVLAGCNNKGNTPPQEKSETVNASGEEGSTDENAVGKDTGTATNISGEPAPTDVPTSQAVIGQALPPIELSDQDGNPIQLRDLFFGKVGVVTFVAEGCAPCVDELKKLKAYLEKEALTQKVMVVVAARSLDGAKAIVEAAGVAYPFFSDNKNEGGGKFAVSAPGTFFLIDNKGQLQSTGVLEIEKEIPGAGVFVSLIKDAVAGKTVDPSVWTADTWKRWSLGELAKRSKAPDFTAAALDGKSYQLSDVLKKKNVVMVFWNRGCPHCQRELPHIQEFYAEKGKELNFEVISVTPTNGEEETDNIRSFVRDYKLTFPVLPVEAGPGVTDSLFDQFGIQSIPAWGVLGRDGKFRVTNAGENEELKTILTKALQEANGKAN